MLQRRYTHWDKLTPAQQDALVHHISTAVCVGIHKSSHAFQIVDDDKMYLIKPNDMEKLVHEGTLPRNILLWPGHGVRYLDFNNEFLELAKLIMTLTGLHGTLQHMRRENDIMSSYSGANLILPSGHHLAMNARLDYTPLGVKLSCSASITRSASKNHTPNEENGWLFMNTELLVPDDKCALKLMATIFQETCTRENILTVDEKVK